jgi:thiol-disulfide isomerase/thioredoxin
VVIIKLADSRTEAGVKPTGLSGGVGGVHSSVASQDEVVSRGNPADTGRGDRLGPAAGVNDPPANPPPASAQPSVRPGLGRPVTTEQTGGNAPVEPKPEYITRGDGPRVRPPPDLMTIPGPGKAGASDGASGAPATAASPSPYFDFPLLDLDRRPTSLAAYRGRLTLVDVWNTGCIPCIEAMPELMRLQRSFGPRGLVLVGVAAREAGSPESVAATIRWRGGKKGVDYPLLMEQEGKSVLALFHAQSFPTLILLDDQGREVWRGVGLTPDNKRQLEAELQRRLQ